MIDGAVHDLDRFTTITQATLLLISSATGEVQSRLMKSLSRPRPKPEPGQKVVRVSDQKLALGTPWPGSTWCGPPLPGLTSKSKIAVGM
ncbi:hypothetical protein GCM10009608_74500 [Pseudonocardia alaniniphila]